jgi:hypothetical protein
MLEDDIAPTAAWREFRPDVGRGASAHRVSLWPAVTAGLLIWSCLAAGCSPALDWREVRTEGGGLTAWLPCKPDRRVRELPLEGAPLRFELLSCTADNSTWGIASAAVDDGAIGGALRALRAARLRNLDGRELSVQPLELKGVAPRPEMSRFAVAGRRPDGSEVVEHAVVFAHGGRVFHAAVLGGSPSAQALETFFDNLRPAP